MQFEWLINSYLAFFFILFFIFCMTTLLQLGVYTCLKKRCREKTTNHKRYDPVVCWETSEQFTDLHFESRSLALFVCFDIAHCASVTHVPDSERMVGGRA